METARTFSPSIDAAANALQHSGDTSDAAGVAHAILAVGKDLAWHLGRLVDELTVESLVRAEERTGFGHTPAGDPTIATKDTASGHRVPAATPSGPIVS